MKKTIVVSNLFIDIYKNFNVYKQVNKMKKLSRKELLLLLILSSESFDESNAIVIENYKEFKKELQILYDSLPDNLDDDKLVIDRDFINLLILLGDETGDKYNDTSKIVDSVGNKLPKPLSEKEALIKRREIEIENIIN